MARILSKLMFFAYSCRMWQAEEKRNRLMANLVRLQKRHLLGTSVYPRTLTPQTNSSRNLRSVKQTKFCSHAKMRLIYPMKRTFHSILSQKMAKRVIILYCTWSSHYDSCKLMPKRKSQTPCSFSSSNCTQWQTMITGRKQMGMKLPNYSIIRSSLWLNENHKSNLHCAAARSLLDGSIHQHCSIYYQCIKIIHAFLS